MKTLNRLDIKHFLVLCCLLLASSLVNAGTSYTLPDDMGSAGTPFSSCSLSSGITYTCSGNVSLAANDSVSLTSSLILNVGSRKFSAASNVAVNTDNSGYSLLIISKEDLEIGDGFIGSVSFQVSSETIDIGKNVTITGNITAKTINIGSNSIVYGICNPSHVKCINSTAAPTVTTLAATALTTTGATLNGQVSSNNLSTSANFVYGLTTAYGNTITASQSPLAANASNTAVSAAVTGLACNTLYHFKAVASNSKGSSSGADRTFTTAACPTLSINNVSAYEGDSGTTEFIFTVTLSSASTNSVEVDANAVSDSADSGVDFQAASGTVSIAPGQTSTSFSVFVNGDTQLEPDETFSVILTAPVNAALGSNFTGTGTIFNDELLADYQFEEVSWNGVANEILDSVGNNPLTRSGSSATNTAYPSTTIASQYSDVAGGFCKAASFDGSAYLKTGSPSPFQNGLETSLTAWVFPTSYAGAALMSVVSNDVRGEFHVTPSGAINFWTGVSNLTTSAKVALNQWSHVAVTFKRGQQSIYINGVLAASGSVNADLPATNSCAFLVGGDVGGGCGIMSERSFKGWIDEVKVAPKVLTATEINAIRTQGRVCASPPVTTVTPASFNCVESGENALTGHLYGKLAGVGFAVDVVALKDNNSDGVADAVESGYASDTNRNVTLQLVDGSSGAACASLPAISPAVSQTVSFSQAAQASEQGRKSSASMTLNSAYQNLRCRVTDASQSPSVTSCSSDNFSVRPSSLSLGSSNANADAAGSSATATPAIQTGAAFNLSATALAGYNGTPKVDTAQLSAHSGAVQNGVLAGTFDSADLATGIASGSDFTYSEVGYFKLAAQGVYDDNFTSVDSGNGDCTDDFSNSAVGGKFGCKFGNTSTTGYFGRFIPDHMQAQLLSNGAFAHSCSSFSYNGQPIVYGSSNHPMLDVFAYNAASPPAITKNYSGSFARLSANQFTLTAPTTDALQKGADNSSLLRLSAAMATPSLTDNGNGNLTLVLGNDSFSYQRENNALIAPFNNSIAIPVTAITDSDGIIASNLPIALQPSGEPIRYGRINLMNANGSELTDLAMGMTAEYFNGTSFVTNAIDQCSVATLSITDPLTSDLLTPANTCIWDNSSLSGSFKCAASAPTGESYREGASLTAGSFNLYLKAPGQTGSLTVNAAVANWLQFNWQGSGVTNPAATATFGVFKGNDKVIFFREVY